jgi:putative ABC transport system substrate-binding protein
MLVGGVLLFQPAASRAQKMVVPVVGFLDSSSADVFGPFVAAFRTGLNETGFVEDRNVRIEYRWADGHYDRLPGLAADNPAATSRASCPSARSSRPNSSNCCTSWYPRLR